MGRYPKKDVLNLYHITKSGKGKRVFRMSWGEQVEVIKLQSEEIANYARRTAKKNQTKP